MAEQADASGAAPFAGLTPAAVLDALDALGWRGDGRLLQLNSYENRVFQVHLEGGEAVVAKFYRPGRWSDAQILEEHALLAELAAAEVPIAAARAHADGSTLGHARVDGVDSRIAVFERRQGQAPEVEDPVVLGRLGQALARLHREGSRRPFAQREAIDLRHGGRRAIDALLASGRIPPEAEAGWKASAEAAWSAAAARAAALGGGLQHLRLHGDCHIGNLLWQRDDRGPLFVDFDDAVTGPAVQDLWMLLPGEATEREAPLAHLLEGYESIRPFDRRELALVEPLRTLRMLRHSAWLAARWHDPSFPPAFPWFESAGYWQQQALQLREQVELLRG